MLTLAIFTFRDGVRNDPGAGLQKGFPLFKEQRPDRDRHIHIAGVGKVPQSPCVGTAL